MGPLDPNTTYGLKLHSASKWALVATCKPPATCRRLCESAVCKQLLTEEVNDCDGWSCGTQLATCCVCTLTAPPHGVGLGRGDTMSLREKSRWALPSTLDCFHQRTLRPRHLWDAWTHAFEAESVTERGNTGGLEHAMFPFQVMYFLLLLSHENSWQRDISSSQLVHRSCDSRKESAVYRHHDVRRGKKKKNK